MESVNAYWKTVAPAKQHERFAPGSKEHIKAKAAGAAPSSGKKAPASKSKRALPADDDEDEPEEEAKVKKESSAKKAAAKKEPSPKKAPALKKKREAKPEPVDSPELDGSVDGEGEADDEGVEVDGRTMYKHEDDYRQLADWEVSSAPGGPDSPPQSGPTDDCVHVATRPEGRHGRTGRRRRAQALDQVVRCRNERLHTPLDY